MHTRIHILEAKALALVATWWLQDRVYESVTKKPIRQTEDPTNSKCIGYDLDRRLMSIDDSKSITRWTYPLNLHPSGKALRANTKSSFICLHGWTVPELYGIVNSYVIYSNSFINNNSNRFVKIVLLKNIIFED